MKAICCKKINTPCLLRAMHTDWLDDGTRHVWRPYCQHSTSPMPLPVVGARGARLELADGRELVDGTASWWTAAHGYGNPHIAKCVRAQLDVLPHVALGGLAHKPAYMLAQRLSAFVGAPFERVFFTESGSVAVEVALKIAMQLHHNSGNPRLTVLAFEGGYHGDTFATMSLCDPVDGMHHVFKNSCIRVLHAPVHISEAELFELIDTVRDDLACIIIEPLLQAAGGMLLYGSSSLQRIRNVADACGALLIFDEIATGMHRLGPRFAFHEANVVPDILIVGKALTGGTLPLAATLVPPWVFDAFSCLPNESDGALRSLQHGPTYMGNALACAAALGSLDLFEEHDYTTEVKNLQERFQNIAQSIQNHSCVRKVRVKGGMMALEMDPGTAPRSEVFAANGAFIRPIRLKNMDVVYLMPSLRLAIPDLDVLESALKKSLAI